MFLHICTFEFNKYKYSIRYPFACKINIEPPESRFLF